MRYLANGGDSLHRGRFVANDDVSRFGFDKVLMDTTRITLLVVKGVILLFSNSDVCEAPNLRAGGKPPSVRGWT